MNAVVWKNIQVVETANRRTWCNLIHISWIYTSWHRKGEQKAGNGLCVLYSYTRLKSRTFYKRELRFIKADLLTDTLYSSIIPVNWSWLPETGYVDKYESWII